MLQQVVHIFTMGLGTLWVLLKAHVLIFLWEDGERSPATSWVHYTTSCNTQSSAPEDGQNNCPKHVELTGITNKPLLLHLVSCLYYLYFIIYF